MTDPTTTHLQQSLHTALATRLHGTPVSPSWLSAFLAQSHRRPDTHEAHPPLAALAQTASFRLLHSDLTATLDVARLVAAGRVFPADVGDARVKERLLQPLMVPLHPGAVDDPGREGGGGIVVQILDVQDVGASRWSQVEAIERVEAGEEVRGREVIRVVDVERQEGHDRGSTASAAATAAAGESGNGGGGGGGGVRTKLSSGPHRLLLQDARGTKASAFELEKIPGLGMSIGDNDGSQGTQIGAKMLLHCPVTVRRGVVMLTGENARVLGGRVEVWDRAWRAGRKERLTGLVVDELQQRRGQG